MNIEVLTQFLDSMRSFSSDLVQELDAGIKLCHYTSLDGAISIIENGDLWLSHLRFSNDDEELHYGLGLVDVELAAALQAAPAESALARRLKRVRDLLQAEREQPIYIGCFCEVDDLLSQWRGYADNGGGVSLEFDSEGFRYFTGPDSPFGLMRLWRVFYDAEQQRRIVRRCIEYPYWPSADEEQIAMHVKDALQFFLPTFKNHAFSAERERRLIFSPRANAPPPRFRVRAGMLVPYLRLKDLSEQQQYRLPLRGVLVGPGQHKTLNTDSLRMALALYNYGNVPVAFTKMPFRG